MSDQTLFDIPTEPEEFGVALPPSQLRRLDFSALEFDTSRRALIEYIKTYYSAEFNDFVAANGVIMLSELVSYIAGVLSQRMDILVDESFLPTAQTKEAVIQHLALIDQSIRRPTPAVVDLETSISQPISTEIRIPPGISFVLTGPDSKPLYYEVFRAPGDFTSDISIPAGKRGVIAWGVEGRSVTSDTYTSTGGPNQIIDIIADNILDDPIKVTVYTSTTAYEVWDRVAIIERSEATDKVYEIQYTSTGMQVIFGDDINGQSPLAGQTIIVAYRVGGGIRGRIGANIIAESRSVTPTAPTNSAVEVNFRNPLPSSGGTDEESISQAKARAPREYATHNAAISGEDYDHIVSTFSHPVYGSVAKSVAIIRTGIDADITQVVKDIRSAPTEEAAQEILLDNYVNRNIVELYVLANGPDGPVTPSAGLKQGIETYLEDLKVLTDEIRVYDGAIKLVDVDAYIIMSRNSDAGTIKEQVDAAIDDFFDIGNFDMGIGLNLSNLYETLQKIAGVKFVNIFKPVDNILPTKKIGSPTEEGVGFNELISLGNVNLKFYFEAGSFSNFK